MHIYMVFIFCACTATLRTIAEELPVGLGSLALTLESEFSDVSIAKRQLESIVRDFNVRYEIKPIRNRREAREELALLNSWLFEKGYTFPWIHFGLDKTFGQSLTNYNANCAGFSYVFAQVLRSRNRPVYPVDMPGHMLVMYLGSDFDVFWETTGDGEYTRMQLIDRYNISEEALRNGCYLLPLSDLDVLSIVYVGLAKVHAMKKDFMTAVELNSFALLLRPNSVAAYVERALAEEALKRYDYALADYKQALLLDPSQSIAIRKTRDIKWARNIEATKAILPFIFGEWANLVP